MTIRQYIKKNGWENECELVPGYRYMIVHINFLNKNKAEIETSLDIKLLMNMIYHHCSTISARKIVSRETP